MTVPYESSFVSLELELWHLLHARLTPAVVAPSSEYWVIHHDADGHLDAARVIAFASSFAGGPNGPEPQLDPMVFFDQVIGTAENLVGRHRLLEGGLSVPAVAAAAESLTRAQVSPAVIVARGLGCRFLRADGTEQTTGLIDAIVYPADGSEWEAEDEHWWAVHAVHDAINRWQDAEEAVARGDVSGLELSDALAALLSASGSGGEASARSKSSA